MRKLLQQTSLLLTLTAAAAAIQAAAQTGSPVYITRPVTVASGMITLTGPITVTIAGQPITVTQSGAVTVVQSGPLTLAQPVTVLFSATPTNRNLIIDAFLNTNVANVGPISVPNTPSTWTGNNGLLTLSALGFFSSGTTVLDPIAVPSSATLGRADANGLATDSITRMRHSSSSNVEWSDTSFFTGNAVTGVGAVGIVDPQINTAVANVIPISGTGNQLTWTNPINGEANLSILATAQSANTLSELTSQNTTGDAHAGFGNPNGLVTNSVGQIWSGGAAFNRWREVDAVSNTQTALGVAAVGEPSFNFTPVTFTSTGSVTYGPFQPQQSMGMVQITTTGTITSATVTIQGSNDGTNFAPLGTTNFTLTTFSGTSLLNWANLAAQYVRVLVTITTLGGTNIITNASIGHP